MKIKTKSKKVKMNKIKSITNTTRIIKRISKNNNLMEPKCLNCFHCQEPFEVHYNRGIGMTSQKNYWNYWIDENWDYKQVRRKPENERGVKICDKSLKEIWLGRKWEYLDQIKNKSRRQTLANYIYHEII